MITERELFEALRGVKDPQMGRDTVELGIANEKACSDCECITEGRKNR